METSKESCDDKRKLWSAAETESFLSICKEVNVINLMDGKKFRTSDIFRKVEELFTANGYDRTAIQLLHKFKAMKKQFMSARNAMSKSGAGTAAKKKCPFYDELDEIFSDRPNVNQTGVDSTILPSVLALYLDEDTSGYHASDSEVSSVTSHQSSTQARRRSIEPTAGCSSWPSTPVTSQESPIPPWTPMGSSASDNDANQRFNSMYRSESRSSGACDEQRPSASKKLKTHNTSKRDTPRSGLKNVMNDFADKMTKSQNDLLEKMLMEQRQSDHNMMIQYNEICTQQTQLLLAGLHSLSSSAPANYSPITPPMLQSNPIFTQDAHVRPSDVRQAYRSSEQSASPVMAFRTSPPVHSIRPTVKSLPSLIKTTIIRRHRDTDQPSPNIARTPTSTSANTVSIPSTSETFQLMCGNDDVDSDIDYEDVEFLDFNH